MSFGEIKKAVNSNLGKSLDTLIEEKTGTVNATGGTATSGGIFAKLNKLLTDWTTSRAGKVDNLDAAISTRASQTSITTLQNTANGINAATAELINGRVVKSVQTGVVAVTATLGTPNTEDTDYTDITIASVNPSKCLVLFVGGASVTSDINAGLTTAYTQATNVWRLTPRLTSATNLRLSKRSSSTFTNLQVGGRWQVIEFY